MGNFIFDKKHIARMSEGKLSYFPLHGRAGSIRMMLKHKGVNFEDNMVQFADWPSIKPTMPGGCMPCWEPAAMPGMKMGQAMAVLHHLGHKHGYLADSDAGTYRQEFVIDCYVDIGDK